MKTAPPRAIANCLLRRALTAIARVFSVAILNEARVSEEAHAKRHLTQLCRKTANRSLWEFHNEDQYPAWSQGKGDEGISL